MNNKLINNKSIKENYIFYRKKLRKKVGILFESGSRVGSGSTPLSCH